MSKCEIPVINCNLIQKYPQITLDDIIKKKI